MKAPFPWFGGKSRVAHLVWERFGDVPNYVEPFAGSLAVLLGRPTQPRIETVNDIDCYLANFWRATVWAPVEVAAASDWPVNEADLHARHKWLVDQEAFRERMKTEPEFFDARVAGWWVWGLCQWIGSGWCEHPEWRGRTNAGDKPRGIQSMWLKRPALQRGRRGVVSASEPSRKLPLIGERGGGRGVLSAPAGKLPLIGSGGIGRGLHSGKIVPDRQHPDISGARGVHSASTGEQLFEVFERLRGRLRRVRVCCGDWKRVLGPSPTTKIGVTGVFLDPPYASERSTVYAQDSFEVAHQVREWAIENGENRDLRIALCGYDGEHDMPAGWDCVAWKAPGGYGNQGTGTKGRDNSRRERIWFSPHCLPPRQRLFEEVRG